MSSIQAATSELHRCFALLNAKYFNGVLPEPAITIQSAGKRQSYGWCSTIPFWHGNNVDGQPTEERHEINLSAEYLNRDRYEIVRTLLHEMVHLHNGILGVQDCSRGNTYHNLRFKAACERDNMFRYEITQPDKKIGWSQAVLTDETRAFVDTMAVDQEAFSMYRAIPERAKKPSNSFKLECPTCGLKLRASKAGVSVRCKTCDEDLIEV